MPKRDATTTQGAPAKCPRTEKFAPVMDAITSASEMGSIGKDTAQMLIQSLPLALGTACSERHDVQTKVARMVEDVLQKVKAALQESLDAASKKVEELEATKGSLEEKVQEAQEALATATRESGTKAELLADAFTQVATAQAAHDAAVAAQSEGEVALGEATQAKDKFAAVVDAHFKVLQGDIDAESCAQHKEAVVQMIEQIDIEDSCRVSFPMVCVKPSSQRTSFDTMVMHAVAEAVEAKSVALASKASELAAAAKTLSSDLETAQSALSAAEAQQQAAMTVETEAVESEKSAKEVVKVALQKRDGFEGEFTNATSEKAAREEELQTFVSHNLGCLEKLRDYEVPKEALEESASVGGA